MQSGFDSSDFQLMRKCPVPVWLCREEDDRVTSGETQKVLAAIDLNQGSEDEGRALNALIMDFATSIAQWEDAELHLLSCWSLYGENTLRNSAFIKLSGKELDNLLERERQYNDAAMSELVNRYDNSEIHRHLIKGIPTEHIPLFA